ncbi:retropepsin-like aspartic protease family protein [Methylobacterium nodulans]|uniref:Putative transmembrane signal peptide protein n=1 Tax=Methylobacterium nodulans (strain LMG 21967 / CNCM I-2342 / ORS 2060) TaxID=460265 RepID=B8IRD8_METNO|nr:TIGR02281 family clan AA aspartic protease [Methylobacterium nodulans]ACL58678.1 putative transmembrane signal peptide protein [Methylobacterium nodulans ORS 2060]
MPGALGLALLLAAAGLAAGMLAEGDIAGWAPQEAAAAAGAAAAALVVLNAIVRQFRIGLGQGMGALALWLALGLGGSVLYAWRDQAREAAFRVFGELAAGEPVVTPSGEVVIARRADGGFSVKARINGREQVFAFDTGASAVVLTAESAAALGLHPRAGAFAVTVQTANGPAMAAPVILDTVAVGPIREQRVPALVTRPGGLSVNLLGMTFLERLASYEVRGSRLILRAAAAPKT